MWRKCNRRLSEKHPAICSLYQRSPPPIPGAYHGIPTTPLVISPAAFAAPTGLRQVSHSRPFEIAQAFFELNTTFHDMGFQVFLDDEAWDHVSLTDPQGNTVFGIHAEGRLAKLGITELHFESEEPSPAEVRALFPNGRYTFRGVTLDGTSLVTQVNVSKDMPPAPSFTPRNGQWSTSSIPA